MSIVHVQSEFAILDEQIYYNKIFEGLNRKICSELYEINSKFMPDSQFEAIKNRGISDKKRKRKFEDKIREISWIEKISAEIQRIGTNSGYFKKSENFDNNLRARKAAERVLHVATPSTSISSTQILEFEESEKLDNLMCNGIISNWIKCSGNGPKTIEDSENRNFFIPPKATFHIGEVTDVQEYSAINEIRFDMVIADPPWFNKSVKRKKTYKMNEQVLDNLDIASITTDDSLIGVWITNRKWVEEEMKARFESWNMEVLGIWKWLKVTTEGEPVYNFDKEKHKIPFETIIFAKKKCSRKEFDLPKKFVFASIPMAVHSHKPPLLDLLSHFNIKFEKPLELFARSLLPSTTSIGYEPFLLQSDQVFISK